jgi:hypothetical protein
VVREASVTWSRSGNVAIIALILALACGAGSTAVLASERDGVDSRAAVIAVDGPVMVRHGDAEFVAALEGDVVGAGDIVRTGAGGSAEITYVDGSSVRLEADAEIVVMSLRTSDGGAVQTLGRAWHALTNLVSGSSRYEVRGPSSTASVRG